MLMEIDGQDFTPRPTPLQCMREYMLGTLLSFLRYVHVVCGIFLEDTYDEIPGMVACFLVPIRWWWVQGSPHRVAEKMKN